MLTGEANTRYPVLSLCVYFNWGHVKTECKKYFNYLVYEDGRIYSNYRKRFLNPDVVQGYWQYTLSDGCGNNFRIKAHRLVALLWLDNKNNYPVVNHIDGNKLNNHYSNLEWCTYEHNNRHAVETGLNNIAKSNSERWNNVEFRKKTSAKMSKSSIERGAHKGSKNGRYRYKITIDDIEISRQDVVKLTGLCISTVDNYIKRTANGEKNKYFEKHNINVTDTKKSQSTIERVDSEKYIVE